MDALARLTLVHAVFLQILEFRLRMMCVKQTAVYKIWVYLVRAL